MDSTPCSQRRTDHREWNLQTKKIRRVDRGIYIGSALREIYDARKAACSASSNRDGGLVHHVVEEMGITNRQLYLAARMMLEQVLLLTGVDCKQSTMLQHLQDCVDRAAESTTASVSILERLVYSEETKHRVYELMILFQTTVFGRSLTADVTVVVMVKCGDKMPECSGWRLLSTAKERATRTESRKFPRALKKRNLTICCLWLSQCQRASLTCFLSSWKAVDVSDTSSTLTSPDPDEYDDHNMWKPMLEVLCHTHIGVPMEALFGEEDFAEDCTFFFVFSHWTSSATNHKFVSEESSHSSHSSLTSQACQAKLGMTKHEVFSGCALPTPPGPTPLWGPGSIPNNWADVGGFLEPPGSQRFWRVNKHGAFTIPRKAFGLRPNDQSCHHETWLYLLFVDWNNKWNHQAHL